MKKIIFLFLFAPILTSAQDCTDHIIKTVDKFTKKVSYSLPFPVMVGVGTDRFGIDIAFSQNTKYLVIAAPTLSCVNEHSKMVLLFDDDTTMELYNVLGFNCTGGMMVTIQGINTGQQAMKNIYVKRVKSIRLSAMADQIDADLDEDQSALLLTSLQCFDQAIKAR